MVMWQQKSKPTILLKIKTSISTPLSILITTSKLGGNEGRQCFCAAEERRDQVLLSFGAQGIPLTSAGQLSKSQRRKGGQQWYDKDQNRTRSCHPQILLTIFWGFQHCFNLSVHLPSVQLWNCWNYTRDEFSPTSYFSTGPNQSCQHWEEQVLRIRWESLKTQLFPFGGWATTIQVKVDSSWNPCLLLNGIAWKYLWNAERWPFVISDSNKEQSWPWDVDYKGETSMPHPFAYCDATNVKNRKGSIYYR